MSKRWQRKRMMLSLPVSSKQQCKICHNTAHVEIIAPPNKREHWSIPTKAGQRQILFVVRCPPSNINPLASPFYCPSVCSLGSPLCLHLFIDHPTLKCQVTLRAKEEHYTAAPCHAGRHHPHSGFNFSAFYRRVSECTFIRVHVWEEWRRETTWGFFSFFLSFF